MKHIFNFILFSLTLSFLSVSSKAQNQDDPVWKALNDELSRNMKSLSYLDYEKPFFINYTIGSSESGVILGSLGGIILSHENKLNTEMIRVMVGSYKICDENFENENSNISYNGGNIPLPLDNDYYGIRRTLWIQTDKVYKAAGETYKNKLYLLKRNNIQIDSLLPDFSKAPVSKLKLDAPLVKYNKEEWEKRVKEISSLFDKYPDIDDSGVSFRFANANTYMVNSEGSEVKSPVNVAVITVSASSSASDGLNLIDKFDVLAPTPNDLPSNDWFQKQIGVMVETLKGLRTAEAFEGNYNGPVLFLDQAASELFSASLFSQEDPLVAIREPLYADRNMKIFNGNNPNSLAAKQNKKVISNDLTVKALPHLKSFENTPLIGHFEIDADGVVPPQEVTLVENGLLKSLLNDRTPIRMVPQSNGHRRFAFFNNGISYITGPGVIDITGKKQFSREDLKKQLIEKAREEGLDYAILIKKVIPKSANYPVEIYKVSVADGKETLIRMAGLNNISLSTLRKCIGVSDKRVAYNMLMNVGPDAGNFGPLTPDISGLPVSFISPDGVLIEEMEVQGAPKNLSEEKPIVPNPVGAK
ncbi:MAG TPA: metallopeptidase TldD-related protein [Bacteroidales bacterium]|nr:metallopeptidase TldD-related protein [Bacteroidales bacterium]